jgi:hypothetical protein
MIDMRVVIVGTNLPGQMFCRPDGSAMNNVHVGIQRRRDPVGLVRADAVEARWDVTIEVLERDGSVDFRGPEVQGTHGERFVYVTWGNVDELGHFEMFRRAKVMLNRVEPELVASVRASGELVAVVNLTADNGGPRCARVDPPAIGWTVRPG